MQADAYLTPSLHAVQVEYLAHFSEEALLFCERTDAMETDTTQPPELFVLGANTAFQQLVQPIEVGRSLTQAWPQLLENFPALTTLADDLVEGATRRFGPSWLASPARLITVIASRISSRHIVLSFKDESEMAQLKTRFERLQKDLDRCRVDAARNQALLTDNMERYLHAAATLQRECLECTEALLPATDSNAQQAITALYALSTNLMRYSMAHRLDFRRTLVDLPLLIHRVIEKYHCEAPRIAVEPRGVTQIMTAAEPLEALLHHLAQAILNNTSESQRLTLICGLNESFVDTHFYVIAKPEAYSLKALETKLTEGDLEYQLARHLAQLLGGELALRYDNEQGSLLFEVFLNQE